MTNFKEIQISEIFDIIWENSKLTKTFIEDNKGDFPVFSWETKNWWAYWYINFYKLEEEILIWTTYWDAWNLKIVNWKFNIWRNASGLRIKDEFKNKVYFQYVKYLCEIYFKLNAQWWKWELRKLPQQRVKDIFIKLPINENWEFDFEKQKEIALKYEKLEKLKDRIRIMKEDIEEVWVKLTEIWKWKEVFISEIFDLNRWKSIYTRKYWDLNKWDFPVYSAGKEQLTSINTYDFDWKYLTWATNGFAWYLKKINWKFSINADRWICIPKTDKIDIDFIRFSIQTDLRNLTKWRVWDKWKNEFTKLSPDKIKENIIIKIPVKENWEFDLEKQKEIALKYEKIEKIQKTLVEELEYLEKVKVEI